MTLRCRAFRDVRAQLKRQGDVRGLEALGQLFKKHLRRCAGCRAAEKSPLQGLPLHG